MSYSAERFTPADRWRAPHTVDRSLPVRVSLSLIARIFPKLLLPAATLRYAPHETILSGRVAHDKFQQPDGRSVRLTLLTLEQGVDVEADGDDAYHVTEVSIHEIQLRPQTPEVSRALKAARGRMVEVEGEIFHGDNECHARPIMMNVTRVEPL